MFVGFDYGSANCAVGIMNEGNISLLPIGDNSHYLSSTLYAYDKELIAEAVYINLPTSLQAEYAKSRRAQLSRAKIIRRELDLTPNEQVVFFGHEALQAYLDMPEEGFYVRSPKSFLGATGLRTDQIALFEDIVTLMMQYIKKIADNALIEKGINGKLNYAVIGRPVNFQRIGGEQSNIQAEAILSLAAKRAGFKNVAFLFEPLAAGMDYESQLTANKTVLVVDVGGGTTDCSVVRMGPDFQHKADRSDDFLGHSGQRVGGNDLDISTAMQAFMPCCGLKSQLVTGKPIPSNPFWNAVAVNDINAQREFASLSCKKLIEDLIKDACEPHLLKRILKVQQHHYSYQIVRCAENAKILLSNSDCTAIKLDFIEPDLSVDVSNDAFKLAVTPTINMIKQLMLAAVSKAGVIPDVIYVTGGTARSPVVLNEIKALYPKTEVVIGDYFGSVTAGLTRWAKKLYGSSITK